jgi:cell envelope opacity-associated protein A
MLNALILKKSVLCVNKWKRGIIARAASLPQMWGDNGLEAFEVFASRHISGDDGKLYNIVIIQCVLLMNGNEGRDCCHMAFS